MQRIASIFNCLRRPYPRLGARDFRRWLCCPAVTRQPSKLLRSRCRSAHATEPQRFTPWLPCFWQEPSRLPKQHSLPVVPCIWTLHNRYSVDVGDLVSKMTPEEKTSQLVNQARNPAAPGSRVRLVEWSLAWSRQCCNRHSIPGAGWTCSNFWCSFDPRRSWSAQKREPSI